MFMVLGELLHLRKVFFIYGAGAASEADAERRTQWDIVVEAVGLGDYL